MFDKKKEISFLMLCVCFVYQTVFILSIYFLETQQANHFHQKKKIKAPGSQTRFFSCSTHFFFKSQISNSPSFMYLLSKPPNLLPCSPRDIRNSFPSFEIFQFIFFLLLKLKIPVSTRNRDQLLLSFCLHQFFRYLNRRSITVR